VDKFVESLYLNALKVDLIAFLSDWLKNEQCFFVTLKSIGYRFFVAVK